MEIITIGRETYGAFAPIIPNEVMSGQIIALGCVEEDEILGCAVAQYEEEVLSLVWLYTVAAHRQKGVADSLVRRMIEIRDQRFSESALAVTYPDDMETADIMNYLMIKHGFQTQTELIHSYIFSAETIKKSKLARKGQPTIASTIVPLEEVSNIARQRFFEASKNSRVVTPSSRDLNDADAKISFALLREGDIKGLFLSKALNEEGAFELSFLYLGENTLAASISFVQACIHHLLEHEDLKTLQFTCLNEKMEQSVRNIFGKDLKPVENRYVHAILI